MHCISPQISMKNSKTQKRYTLAFPSYASQFRISSAQQLRDAWCRASGRTEQPKRTWLDRLLDVAGAKLEKDRRRVTCVFQEAELEKTPFRRDKQRVTVESRWERCVQMSHSPQWNSHHAVQWCTKTTIRMVAFWWNWDAKLGRHWLLPCQKGEQCVEVCIPKRPILQLQRLYVHQKREVE